MRLRARRSSRSVISSAISSGSAGLDVFTLHGTELPNDVVHVPRGGDVIAAFHTCARTREPIWMRQVMKLNDAAPRYVEGVAVFLEPERIYGGLIMGELSDTGVESGFERVSLKR